MPVEKKSPETKSLETAPTENTPIETPQVESTPRAAVPDDDGSPDPVLDFLPRLYLPLLLLFLAAATWRPLTGAEDFWAHAAVGKWIWQHQAVPHETLWLWSTPPVEWIAHSWLSQLAYFVVMQLGGAALVLSLTVVLAALPFFWFWRLWARRGGINAVTPVFFAFAIWCACIRFQPRPELFSAVFLSLLLLFLIDYPRSMTRPNSFGIVAMFVLWANFHGAVALGLLVLFLTAVCELAQQKLARPAWQLAALSVACAVAINFNPYGFLYWKALAPIGGATFRLIDEWKSPLAFPALPPEAVGFVLLVAIIAALSWAKNPQRRWSQLAWLVLGCTLFLTARRNLWPCVLISVAVASANASSLSTLLSLQLPLRARFLARGVAVAVLIAGILTVLSPIVFSVQSGVLQLHATAPVLPRGAADTVLEKQLPSPVFNDYLRSGYFHWRFSGRPPLYIDLLNAYPDFLLAEYFEVIKRTPVGKARWEKLGVNTVVFGSYRKTDRLAPIAEYLDNSPQWQKVYSAADGAVWVRRAAWSSALGKTQLKRAAS